MVYRYDSELEGVVASIPTGTLVDPVASRQSINEMLSVFNTDIDTSGLTIEDRAISNSEGAGDLMLRIYSPIEITNKVAGLLYVHGGGFVVGSLDTEHASAVSIARDLNIVVVSVDYRLAPEYPFPAGLNDCYRALEWMHDSAVELNVDSERIGIFGQSAGGGLCAALALMARDQKGPGICFQYLGMPELDDRLETVSMMTFTDTPMWHRPNAELSWQYYLGDKYTAGGHDVPVYAAPARVEDASGLPPAYISAMEFDPLRDEDIHYALKLMECGVAVELHTFPGTFHGSAMLMHAAVSRRQQQEMLDVLKRGLIV